MRKKVQSEQQHPKPEGRVLARILAEDLQQVAGGFPTFTKGYEPGTWDYD
jgi:hypothetical protein